MYIVVILLLWLMPSKPSVTIQPYGISQTDISFIKEKLVEYNFKVEVLPSSKLPDNAYYKPRNRYKALIMLDYLKHQSFKTDKILGITNKDISKDRYGYEDYGIMGLAYLNGPSAINSTFRTRNNNTFLFLAIIHELAHTYGVQHCKSNKCIMQEGPYNFGKTHPFAVNTKFCINCQKKLTNKNWKVLDI